jgi:hypothetical protein
MIQSGMRYATVIARGDPMSALTLAKQTPVETLPLEELIRRRAYELYVQRGNQAGSDIEDWLQAEADFYVPKEMPA